MSKEEEYTGPMTSQYYSDDQEEMETFDDLADDTFDGENSDQYEDEDEKPAPKKAAPAKKEKNDLEILDSIKDEDEEEEKPAPKKATEEDEDEEEELPKVEEEKPAKGKPTYLTMDGETFPIDSNAEITVPVDGKNTKVSLQELKNNYAGKVAWDTRFNEINLKNTDLKRKESEYMEKSQAFDNVKNQILGIIQDPNKNPKDALEIFLDTVGVDSYDLKERAFKHDLEELYKVLTMDEISRKAYFVEKKNEHLSKTLQKREEVYTTNEKVRTYTQKVNALRNSYGVSEEQYMDSLEELKSFGYEDKDVSEQDIVEWSATKPHRATVTELVQPYKDQIHPEQYASLLWDLSMSLLKRQDTKESIQRNLASAFQPQEVKSLKDKLKPIGRPKGSSPATRVPAKAQVFESFDDLD